MREEIIKYQTLEFINNLMEIKKKEIKTYRKKLNRLEVGRINGLNSYFDKKLYELTRMRYESLKEFDHMLSKLWQKRI